MRGNVTTVLLAAGMTVSAITPSLAAGPQRVAVVNQTRFEPIAREIVIPAGQSQRFEVRSDNYGRVSVLVAGVAPAAGDVSIATVYGPPFVPSGPPRALREDSDGNIRDRLLESVLGPVLVIVVKNDSAGDATLTLSAYLAN